MTQRRTNRKADTISDRTHRSSPDIETAFALIAERKRNTITLSANPTDRDGSSSKGDHSDPTARAMLQMHYHDQDEQELRDALKTGEVWITMLESIIRRIHTPPEARGRNATDKEPAPRCIGDNTATGATCWQIPTERRHPTTHQTINDGRCIDCGRRVDQARKDKAEYERKRRQNSAA